MTPKHTTAWLSRKKAVDLTRQPAGNNSFTGIVYAVSIVPLLLECCSPKARAALAACCRGLRQSVHQAAKVVFINKRDMWVLRKGLPWTRLAVLLLRQQCTEAQAEIGLSGTGLQLQAAVHWSTQSRHQKHTALVVSTKQDCQTADSAAAFQYLQSRLWRQVTTIGFSNLRLEAELVMQQLARGCWASLQSLDLTAVQLSPALLQHVPPSAFKHIRYLSIRGLITDHLAPMLTAVVGNMPRLNDLRVEGFRLTHTCAGLMPGILRKIGQLELCSLWFDWRGKLVEGRHPWMLRSLILKHHQLYREAAQMLFAAPLRYLQVLQLISNSVSQLGLMQLYSCALPALQFLEISDVNLSNDTVQLLAKGRWDNLECLRLAGVPLNATKLQLLVKGKWPLLNVLHLDPTKIDLGGWRILSLNPAYAATNNSMEHMVSARRFAYTFWPNLDTVTFVVPPGSVPWRVPIQFIDPH